MPIDPNRPRPIDPDQRTAEKIADVRREAERLSRTAGPPRIVRGIVNEDGSVYAGSGFTATRSSVGIYYVTFASPFGSIVVPTVTPVAQNTTRTVFPFIGDLGGLTGAYFAAVFLNTAGSGYVDVRFAFHVLAVA